MKFIPFALPEIGKAEINEVVDTLKSGWLTTGPKTLQFETNLSKYIGGTEVIALSSCTAALHLALAASGIGKGDEVITTPFTFAATSNVIVHTGAVPVFADIDFETYTIDPEKVEKAVTRKTKAIIAVSYAGHPCNMSALRRIANKYKLLLIEDAAHSIGTEYKGKKVGSIADITCFSFYTTKNITTGEGGAIAVKNKTLAKKMRTLSLHGMSKDAWKRYSKKGSWYYDILDAGFKYNMSNIQASIGIHQLKKLDSFIRKKAKIAKQYTKAFKNCENIITPACGKGIKHAWHLYPVRVLYRDKFITEMSKRSIGTSVHFIPQHLQSFYQKQFKYKRGDFPVTEYIFNTIVSLPIYTVLKQNQVNHIIKSVKEIACD